MRAWEELGAGKPNSLVESLMGDVRISRWVKAETIDELMQASVHIGDVEERCDGFLKELKIALEEGEL